MPSRGSGRPLVCIFVGPSLAAAEVRAILAPVDARVRVLPPAEQGSLLRLVNVRPDVVAIIDGAFFHVPSLLHREILLLMEQGARILGAASLGALRAAELDSFGMEGVGQIYQWYRDGAIDGDDEVAVAHGEADTGYRPQSVALVNVRHDLGRAHRRGIIRARTARVALAIARRTFFAERTYESLVAAPDLQSYDLAGEVTALRHFLQEEPADLKGDDARLLVQRVARRLAGKEPWPDRPEVRANHSGHFQGFWERYVGHPAEGWHVPDSFTLALYRILSPSYPELHQRVTVQCLAVEEATYRGLVADPDDVLLARFRTEHDLTGDEEYGRWLRARHLTAADLLQVLRARDLEARLRTQYQTVDPLLTDSVRFAERLRADLAGRTGVPEETFAGALLMPPGVPWTRPYLRELKLVGQFSQALHIAGQVFAASATRESQRSTGDEIDVDTPALWAWLAARWRVEPAAVWRAASERGFTRAADLLDATRQIYLYERSGHRVNEAGSDLGAAQQP
jgi:hypothetical protein